MDKRYEELERELKNLQAALINIAFIADDFTQEDIQLEKMQCYPFSEDLATITANVADWIDEIEERE